ncbi:MAG TPA: hypothetical protein VN133_07290, partial [Humibacter sp.]|nr:hypothetical protein [Humibacter sp.]
LAGCTPSAPKPTHSPTASRTPMFASDEEALKAATDAYAAYLKMSDTIFSEGGIDPERMSTVAIGQTLRTDIAGFATAKKRGWKQIGMTQFDGVRLQSVTAHGVRVYACVDVSGVDVVNADGKSIVSEQRPARSAVVVALEAPPADNRLLVASNDPWGGNGVC